MSAKDRGRYHATESLHYAQKQISFVSDEKEDLQQKRAFDEEVGFSFRGGGGVFEFSLCPYESVSSVFDEE